jgi:hypothetical protein
VSIRGNAEELQGRQMAFGDRPRSRRRRIRAVSSTGENGFRT